MMNRLLAWLRPATSEVEGATMFVVRRYDRPLLLLTLVLMGFGLVMVYSASAFFAEQMHRGDGAYYLMRQLKYIGVALVVMVIAMNAHHEILRRLAIPIFGVAVLALLVLLVPGISATAKGAARWISFGSLRFQPSELAKIAWIVTLAALLSSRQERLHRFWSAWVMPLAGFVMLAALLMAQPDFGSTAICGALMVLLVWAAGSRHRDVAGFMLVGVGLATVAVLAAPYRIKRIMTFLNPEADPLGAGFHINQALISFGSGEWSGLGLGASKQKMLYLPEAHTDFIFSIIGEELGVVGVGFTVFLMAGFVWRGFTIARRASSAFGALLAFGLTAEIGFQAVVNMGVATALLPTKGLTLPFISYGGSSIVLLGGAVGVLLNISRRDPPPRWIHWPILERIPMWKQASG